MAGRLPQRIEFSIRTCADPELCWRVFTDWEGWNSFLPGTYGKIEWIQGRPWAIGSRVRMEILRPIKFGTECVIVLSSSPHKIAWIHHEMQNVVEQYVSFQPDRRGGTNISVWLEVNGQTLEVAGRDIVEVMREFKLQWYSRFAQRCDDLALNSTGRKLA